MSERYGLLDKRLLLDTGIIKNLFHRNKPENERRFWRSLNARSYTKSNVPFFISTALMGVELLGFKIHQLDPYRCDEQIGTIVRDTFSNMTIQSIHDDLARLITVFMNWLELHQDLSAEALQQRNAKEVAFRSEWAQGLMGMLVGTRLKNPSLRKAFFRNIAYDRLQAVPYDEFVADVAVLKKIDVAFLTASLVDLAEDRSAATCRITDSLLVRAAKTLNKPEQPEPSYDHLHDSLDTEIVYFAATGHKNRATDKLEAVAAFTIERLETWRPRLANLFGVIRYLDGIKRESSTSLTIRPGFIVRVDAKTADVIDVLDVMKEIERGDVACEQDLTFQQWNDVRNRIT